MNKTVLLLWLTAFTLTCPSVSSKNKTKEKSSGEAPIGPNYNNLQLEKLGRGLVAIYQGKGLVVVSWRKLMEDTKKVTFDLYRKSYLPGVTKLKEVHLNEKPLKTSTFFVDKSVDSTIKQEYILVESKSRKKVVSYMLTPERAAVPYIAIKLPPIDWDTTRAYMPNEASVGDLDGDGEYEIVLKRQIGNFDCSQPGISGGTNHLEAYKLDGKRLWQVDIGINVREGADYFSFMVNDFDGDGKSEVICKTSEGTSFGNGKKIGDFNLDGIVDYVIRDPSLRTYGKILSGPEFISVIEGSTGKELERVDYIPRGNMIEWGDDDGNRMDRQLSAVAYLDGKRPSYLVARGSNGKFVIQAWNYRDGKMTKIWTFDTHANNQKYIAWSNQGSHNIRIGDVDHDGKDEIIYGACAIDDDGSGLYTTGWGHGDAVQLADIDPDKPGLEVWQCHEYAPSPNGSSLRNAATGKLIWGFPSSAEVDRALCADIDPDTRGLELWSSGTNGLYSCKGKLLSKITPPLSMTVWWDGDLSRELLDKIYIYKWNGNGTNVLFNGKGKGITWSNGTKATPCLSADILGDWREEVIWSSQDGSEIRIYTTDKPTEHAFTTFMQDPVYRIGVATENAGYNQPPQPGYYFGTDKVRLF